MSQARYPAARGRRLAQARLDKPSGLRCSSQIGRTLVLRDLAVLGFLASHFSGNPAPQLELAIIHHTDCGMSRLANPTAQQEFAERLGIEPAEVAPMAITDPAESVRVDIEALRRMPAAPGSLVVSGHVYDVATGSLSETVEPDLLRLGEAG